MLAFFWDDFTVERDISQAYRNINVTENLKLTKINVSKFSWSCIIEPHIICVTALDDIQPILVIHPIPQPLSDDTVECMCYNRTVILKMKNYIHFLPPSSLAKRSPTYFCSEFQVQHCDFLIG